MTRTSHTTLLEGLAEASPAERVAAAFEAVAAIDDPAVFIATADRDRALAAIDESLPLAGLTFAVKNNIDVEGFDTTAGCPSYAFRPDRSATVVRRLLDAGATCVGVTNLDQFATGLVGTRSPYGVPRNPIDARLVPGGSSSGSAVAVARELVDFALGTDTAGSGRVPAAQNRIVGLKPTRGLLPMTGVVPAVRSIDCVSIFARSVGLAARALDACAGFDGADPWSRRAGAAPLTMPTLVVGVPAIDAAFRSSQDLAAWRSSVAALGMLDHVELVDVDISALIEAGDLLYGGPWVAERYAAVGSFLDTEPSDADPTVSGIIRGARRHSAVDAYKAGYHLAEIAGRAAEMWTVADVLMVPTTSGVATLEEVAADPVGRNNELGRFTNGVNLLDLSAVAVPGCDRSDGWPFGVSLIGRAWAEPTLIDLVARLGAEDGGPDVAPFAGPSTVDVVVVGAHLRGQPLNWQVTDRGGRFVRATATAPVYRLYAIAGSPPMRPALVHVGADGGGASIEVEVWRLPAAEVGAFMLQIAPPLGLGRVELADGTQSVGFIAEPRAVRGATDITIHGGWRAFLATIDRSL